MTTPILQTSPSGLTATWLPFGAHLISVRLPDGTDILAKHDLPETYQGAGPYLGSIIGRVANRIGGAAFTIDGQSYAIAHNDNGHALHSGPDGFDRQVWDVTQEGEELVFRHTSPAGDQGYPGNLDVTLRTRLSDNELQITFIAITDAPTPVNLSQHGYWNPTGLFDRRLDTLRLSSPADRYTEVGEDLIPTGMSPAVDGTPYDFRSPRRIGPDFIDVNLLVPGDGLREMAKLTDGMRSVTILSDYPGLQIYSGESLDAVAGMNARAALAMEPQYPPDAINQPVDGEDTILRPGEVYRHTIIYRFDGPGFEAAALNDATP
ncbi:aldose 1-epimerase [Algimonas arctica]|uniref:Aldose 1-epimerase n=1 Tax=Algimonas arctica TaxID=1479486 RepID=A0A8J3G2F9_9PROT|nr:aldose epimerase family protein [Algimonas arctica]GHA96231.1 aldose 1-epimerase [Algimonas arctica]